MLVFFGLDATQASRPLEFAIKVSECLATLCPGVIWKVELVSNEYGYLTQKIFKMLKRLLISKTGDGEIN